MSELPPEVAAQVLAIAEKYAGILGYELEEVDVEIFNNVGSAWLGRTIFKPKEGVVRIDLQASILPHPETLERVLAHEMIHYVDFMNLPPSELVLLRMGRKLDDGHGERFRRMAAQINDAVGEELVTEKSDERYETAPNEREFMIIIEEGPRGRIGWSWAVKPSKDGRVIIDRKVASGAVLATTTDERFTRGNRIGKGKIGMKLAKEGSEVESELRRLWNQGKEST